MEDVKGQEGAETRISCTDKKAKTQSLEWAKAYWRLGRGRPGQWSPSLSAPGTGFLEDSFLKDQGGVGVGGGGFEMIQVHYIHYALYF